jgi:hypothetical protein
MFYFVMLAFACSPEMLKSDKIHVNVLRDNRKICIEKISHHNNTIFTEYSTQINSSYFQTSGVIYQALLKDRADNKLK